MCFDAPFADNQTVLIDAKCRQCGNVFQRRTHTHVFCSIRCKGKYSRAIRRQKGQDYTYWNAFQIAIIQANITYSIDEADRLAMIKRAKEHECTMIFE